jgi:hypothetical protein
MATCGNFERGGLKKGIAVAARSLHAIQQAWRLHVYILTVAARGALIRTIETADARQALVAWFDEEATGYEVSCTDESGAPVLRGRLRTESRSVSTLAP